MAQYTKSVPKNPTSADETLETVLEVVIFLTQDGDELISYQIKPDRVLLTFDGAD